MFDSAILWPVAYQAPLSMEFSRQEYWSGLLCHPPRDLPNPGIKLTSLTSPALAGRFFTTSSTWEAQQTHEEGADGGKERATGGMQGAGTSCQRVLTSTPWTRRSRMGCPSLIRPFILSRVRAHSLSLFPPPLISGGQILSKEYL